ncbi:MAG: BlaI/MecI/CopY family transcriptional regulator [Acidobacteriaceae bacterium]
MPRKTSQTLTEAELRIMQVLWQKGPGTVQQILDVLPAHPAFAYNTILTTIRILERKGWVEHSKDGRAHVYNPLVAEEEASRSEIRHLVSRFFRNSHEDLVLNILEDRGIDAKELARLRKMLERSEGDAAGSKEGRMAADRKLSTRGEAR